MNTTNPTKLGKRDYQELGKGKNRNPNKKSRYEDITFQVRINYDYSSMDSNMVFVSKATYNKLFQNSIENNYLKIGHYIYEVGPKDDVSDTSIEINEFQEVNLEHFLLVDSNANKSIFVKKFYANQNNRFAPIKRLVLELDPYSCSEYDDKKKSTTKIDVIELIQIVKNKFIGQFFENEQIFFIDYKRGQFKATVKKQFFFKSKKEELSILWGRINEETKIDFTCDSKKVCLIKKINDIKIEKYFCKISEINQATQRLIKGNNTKTTLEESWKDRLSPMPLCITFSNLVKEIRYAFEGKDVCVEDEQIIRLTTDWKIKVVLYKVSLSENIDLPKKNKEYTWSFPFKKEIPMEINTLSNILFTVDEDKTTYASIMEFNILDINEKQNYENSNEKFWLSIEEIKKEIQETYISLPLRGRMTLQLGRYLILVELTNCVRSPYAPTSIEKNLKEIWGIEPDTEIKITKKQNLSLKLVDSNNIYPLKKIRVKVQRIIIGHKNDQRPLLIKEKIIREKFFNCLPEYLFKNQKLECIIDGQNALLLHLDNYSYSEEGQIFHYGALFKCDNNTEINFEVINNSNIIIDRNESGQPINLKEKLKNLGIGGLPEEAINFVKGIYYSRNDYKNQYEDLKIKPERGVLFYGPPGTGKTLLAKNLAEILGVSEVNTKKICATDVLNKYVGESEKKMRELFNNAREDQIKYGDKSPLHLLIIDEIEAVLKERKDDSRTWEVSVVNTFLSQLDGINGTLNNIIVIGLTNKMHLIDKAVIRSGRLGTHIHIGLPNSQGRREIFEIYLQECIKNNYLEENHGYLDSLVKMTIGKSGAFIEALVREAGKSAITRSLSELSEKIEASQKLKITKDDFNKAFSTLTKKDNDPSKIEDYFIEQQINPLNLRRNFEELGIIGINDTVVNSIKDLILTRIIYNDELKKLNYAFPKGLFISGPSGTGKTKLAKSLKSIFGLREEQFYFYHASTLWQKSNQLLKKEIERIFDPIFDAAKDLQEQSPLFMVVIDGIDEFFSHSSIKSPHPFSLMHLFFEEIENLKDSQNFPENLLIVYTSSFDRNLDSRFLKYSKQGTFIKLDLPTFKERSKIFKYYLEPAIKEEKIVKEIDYKKLALLTEKQTGAFIEATVALAIKNSLKKIDFLSLTKEIPKLSMNDLIQAINELNSDEEWKRQLFI